MFNKIFKWLGLPEAQTFLSPTQITCLIPKQPLKIEEEKQIVETPPVKSDGFFSTEILENFRETNVYKKALDRTFVREAEITVPEGTAMDSTGKSCFADQNCFIPNTQLNWYSYQGFIGYQAAAMLAQQWLISKACVQPAQDAVRNGYDISVNDGTEVSLETLDLIRKRDKDFNITENLVEFVNLGRVFGVRIAMFKVDSDDPDYYLKPFNPDGVMPGSYKGIAQIDPYWMAPELDGEAASDPASIGFYEPTWWRVNSLRIHKSHLVIMRVGELPDILKPTYLYGGIPIPQKIYERVYAAERTANEAPLLALTKRTMVRKVDLSQVAVKEGNFKTRMELTAYLHNNYGTQFIGLEEEAQQFDTSLADLDVVIMTQYQLVAAACNVPAVKLLGTSPKGFNATGEYEEASYHEELKSIQEHVLTPFLERHHLLLIRSEISPDAPFSTTITWNPCDSPTEKEREESNRLKAETGAFLIESGALSPEEERKRVIDDPESGYAGLQENIKDNDILEEGSLEEGGNFGG